MKCWSANGTSSNQRAVLIPLPTHSPHPRSPPRHGPNQILSRSRQLCPQEYPIVAISPSPLGPGPRSLTWVTITASQRALLPLLPHTHLRFVSVHSQREL